MFNECSFVTSGSADDGINIQTKNLQLIGISQDTNTIQLCTYGDGVLTVPLLPQSIFPGDLLEIANKATPFNPFVTATVKTATQGTDYFNATLVGGLPPGIAVGDIVATLPSAILRNFTVRNNRAHGILLKNRNTLVDGCYFINNTDPAVQISTDCGYYWERFLHQEHHHTEQRPLWWELPGKYRRNWPPGPADHIC